MTAATTRPLARQITVLTDAELDQYLEQHNRVISVQDPDQLPESFIERLRDRTQHASIPALDLNQLNIRLLGAAQQPTPERWLSHSRSPTRSPSPIEDREREQYRELVRSGGRPGYPLDLVEDVFRNPTKHRDMLLPFLTTPSDWECPIVFTKQVGRWSGFRGWQYAVRKTKSGRGRRHGLLSDECWRALQEFNQGRESSGLAAYAEAAKCAVLDPNGLDDYFKPKVDPLQQDKLTTWLEYLVFKHCVSVYCRTRVKTHQAYYDKAWAKLDSLGVLRPSEIRLQQIEDNNLQTGCRRIEAEAAAEVRDAEEVQLQSELTAEYESGSAKAVAVSSRLVTARAKLERVRARLTAIENFLVDTVEFRAHGSYWKMVADAHSKELPWVLQQLPVVRRDTRKSTQRATEGQVPLRRSLRIASQRLARTSIAQIPNAAAGKRRHVSVEKSTPLLQEVRLAEGSERKRRVAVGVSSQALPEGARKRRQLR